MTSTADILRFPILETTGSTVFLSKDFPKILKNNFQLIML